MFRRLIRSLYKAFYSRSADSSRERLPYSQLRDDIKNITLGASKDAIAGAKFALDQPCCWSVRSPRQSLHDKLRQLKIEVTFLTFAAR